MSSPKQFSATMRAWSDLFMTHSMKAWMRYVRASGLSMPQFNVLMRLYYKGECGVNDISEHLNVSAAAASQLVDALVNKDLLARVENPNDRRAKQISLSPKARALIEKGMETRNAWLDDLNAHLTPEQRAAAIETLNTLIEATKKIDNEA